MKFGYFEILALGDRLSSAYMSIEHEIREWGNLTYKHEKSFAKAEDILDFIRNSTFDFVLMPNPYGNEKRRWIYNHLKSCNFPVIVFDRGALPDSWFFDTGFNADSGTYHPILWDKPLTDAQTADILDYIKRVKESLSPLEAQGPKKNKEELYAQLGISTDRKILFVPFQRPSDTTIRFFSGQISSFENFCKLVDDVNRKLEAVRSDWVLVAKKHPLESERPSVNVRFVNDDENINSLLDIASAVLVVNSGTGLLASLWGKPVFCAGDAFYRHPKLNQNVRTCDDVLYALESFTSIDLEVRNRFIYYLKEKVYSFGKFSTERVLQKDGSYRNITRMIDFYKVNRPAVLQKKKFY